MQFAFGVRPAAAVALLLAVALTGCVDDTEEDPGQPGVPDQGGGDVGVGAPGETQTVTQTSTPTATPAPGEGTIRVDVNGTSRLCPQGSDAAGDRCFWVTAENTGSETVQVSSICVPPWLDTMRRGEKAVEHREPVAYCAAFGTRDMVPGETIEARFMWDGRVWTDGPEGYRPSPAPAGTYTWTATFRYYHAEEATAVPISVDIVVT